MISTIAVFFGGGFGALVRYFISKLFSVKKKKKFIYKVKMSKKNYLEMIKKRYISILLDLNEKELFKGIGQIKLKYGKNLQFRDILNCIIL